MKTIELSGGKVAIVDDEDYNELAQHKWYCAARGYAGRTIKRDGKNFTVYIHRVVVDAPQGMFVKHTNGDPLDNRKENLRICTSRRIVRRGRKIKGERKATTAQQIVDLYQEGETFYGIAQQLGVTEGQAIGATTAVLGLVRCENCGELIEPPDTLCEVCRTGRQDIRIPDDWGALLEAMART